MKHTDVQIEEAARRFETLADDLDPGTAQVEKGRRIGAFAEVGRFRVYHAPQVVCFPLPVVQFAVADASLSTVAG